MRKSTALIFTVILLAALAAHAQQKSPDVKNLRIVNRQLTIGPDGKTLHFNEAPGAGIAWITGKQFTYGTIEFDVKGKDKFQASFVGIAFHGQNDSTYECVYFRPFNFQSDDTARKVHAVQYIALPQFDWPVLRSQFPNKYEQPVSPAPNPDNWFHVRIIISAKAITVFVNGNTNASLTVTPLVSLKGNMIGYWVGNGSGADWKNLRIIPAKD